MLIMRIICFIVNNEDSVSVLIMRTVCFIVNNEDSVFLC